jgi:hypothetical protein
MFCSSDEFAQNYFWRHVDHNISTYEFCELKHLLPTHFCWNSILEKYAHCFQNENDVANFNMVCSIIPKNDFKKFMLYYMTSLKRISPTYKFVKIEDENRLKEYVDDEEKFKILIVCLYYYF